MSRDQSFPEAGSSEQGSPEADRPEGAWPGAAPGQPRYEWIERIAWREGREVWRARQIWPPRTVALKLDRDLEPLRREADAHLQVGLPWVPEVIEIGEIPTPDASQWVPALVLDWLDGVALDVAARELSLEERLECFANLCDAAEAIHRSGIAHGDLKPANVIVGAAREVRILDLGSARPTAGLPPPLILATPAKSAPTAATASLAYAAPERARGAPASAAADIYSLGVILYELIAGARPWLAEEGQGPAALRRALIHDDPPSPRLLVPRLPVALEAVTLRALAARPGRRYGSAAALGAEVRRALAGEPVEARRPGAAERLRDYLRRRPAHAASFAAILLSLACAIGAALAGSTEARAAQRRSARLREPLERAGSLLLDRVAALDLRSGTLAARERWIQLAESTIAAAEADASPGAASELEARLHRLLGDLFAEQVEPRRATESFRRAREIYAARYAADPSAHLGAALSISTVRIGDIAKGDGDLATAADCYRAAFRLDLELHEADPEDLTLLDNLGYSHERIGDLALRFGDREGAREHFEERCRIAHSAFLREPTPHRAFGLLQAEGILSALGEWDGCRERTHSHLRRAYEWGEWILERTPDDRKVQRRHVATLLSLADRLREAPGPGTDAGPAPEWLLARAHTISALVRDADPHDREAARLSSECARLARECAAPPVAGGDPAEGAEIAAARALAGISGTTLRAAAWLPHPVEAWLAAFLSSSDAVGLIAAAAGSGDEESAEECADLGGEGER